MAGLLLIAWKFITAGFNYLLQAFLWLFEHPKILLTIVLICLASYGSYKIVHTIKTYKNEVAELTHEKSELISEVDRLEGEIEKAALANEQCQRIIDEFKAENQKIADKNNKLAQDNKKTQESLDQLRAALGEMGPADDGPVAHVLRKAILGIEKQRIEREKSW
jgi:uncharacterized protein YoxC